MTSSECVWAEPIYLERGDKVSPETEDKIIAHNQLHERYCK